MAKIKLAPRKKREVCQLTLTSAQFQGVLSVTNSVVPFTGEAKC